VDKLEKLSDYKVLYAPRATYQDEEAYKAMVEYVNNGGILVLSDPDAFRWRPDGTQRADIHSDLMGVKVNGDISDPGMMKIGLIEIADGTPLANVNKLAGTKLATFAKTAADLEVLDGTATLATFENGKPALVMKNVGKGRVITFATSPYRINMFGSSAWWDLFKAFQIDFGCEVDCDLWRFRFPLDETEMPPVEPENMVCLTGNACHWEQERVVEGANANLAVEYAYSVAPDLIPEENAEASRWNLKTGDLFDRAASLRSEPVVPRGKDRIEDLLVPWAVAWKKGEEIAVRLTFEQEVSAEQLKLWAHGEIPEIEIGTLIDGKYACAGGLSSPGDSDRDVREISLKFAPVKAKEFEIRFGSRMHGNFYLGEVELWGNRRRLR